MVEIVYGGNVSRIGHMYIGLHRTLADKGGVCCAGVACLLVLFSEFALNGTSTSIYY